MQKYPLWKPCLILVVLAVCVALIYPPGRKLKLGLDLAGGTILIYQVDIPSGANPEQMINETIDILRRRIDPAGLRSLIWRPLAGGRLEIQMPRASEEANTKGDAYVKSLQQLLAQNISQDAVMSALRAPAGEQKKDFAQLAAGDAKRQEAFDALAKAYNALNAARTPYEELSKNVAQADKSLAAIPPSTQPESNSARKALEAHKTELVAQLIPATAAYVQATDAYNAGMAKVMSSNIDPDQLHAMLALPLLPEGQARRDPDMTYRQDALARLITDHPAQEGQITKVADDWAAYNKLKGQLDDPNDLIAMLRGSGVLEFRIAPQAGKLPEEQAYRDQLRDQGPRGGDKPYQWFIVDDPKKFAPTVADMKLLQSDAAAYFKTRDGLIGQKYAGDYYLLMDNTPETTITQAKPGWELKRAYPSSDQQGLPAVAFQLNAVGGLLMHQLTAARVGQPLAIVLDGRVYSAPNINQPLDANIEVSAGSGGFSPEEQSYLVRTLNAGTLKARLGDTPISIQKIGPGAGAENLKAGLHAGIWSFALVGSFMALYYFFWGVVADTALVLNVLIIMAFMALTQSAFTLPGIAGIVLTIGMSVDANVLILERLREEMDRGVDLMTGVRLGYERAFATIFDSHVTTIITCVVLYYTATADIKGFALTLGVGVVSSLFTALFCTRTITTMYLTYFKPATVKMLSTAVPAVHRMLSPNIDWVGMKYIMLTGSVSLVIGSVILVGFRMYENNMLDIEFSSGTQVSFDIRADHEPVAVDMIQSTLDKAAAQRGISALAEANVVTLGNTTVEHGKVYARSFSISTLDQDANQVSDTIKDVFADLLDIQRPYKFTGIDAKLADAPVYPVVSADLGKDINMPSVKDEVPDYLGGVAINLNNISPPATLKDITDRITRIELQSNDPNAQIGSRPFVVRGVTLAPDSGDKYTQVVVVARDRDTNYITNPSAFTEDVHGLAATEWDLVRTAMTHDTSLASVSNFNSSVSSTMQERAIAALVLSLLAVTIYVWFRFGKAGYGVGAIVALFHDVGIALGGIALGHYLYDTPVGRALLLSDFKINLALIAALLTIVGYSLNDTIVVFDRIRENKGKLPYATPRIINDAINQTISRTILTSGTTFISAMVLYVVGGEAVHGFAFAMVIGVVVGTYSSIAIASPILLIHRQLTESSPTTGAGKANAASVH